MRPANLPRANACIFRLLVHLRLAKILFLGKNSFKQPLHNSRFNQEASLGWGWSLHRIINGIYTSIMWITSLLYMIWDEISCMYILSIILIYGNFKITLAMVPYGFESRVTAHLKAFKNWNQREQGQEMSNLNVRQ